MDPVLFAEAASNISCDSQQADMRWQQTLNISCCLTLTEVGKLLVLACKTQPAKVAMACQHKAFLQGK